MAEHALKLRYQRAQFFFAVIIQRLMLCRIFYAPIIDPLHVEYRSSVAQLQHFIFSHVPSELMADAENFSPHLIRVLLQCIDELLAFGVTHFAAVLGAAAGVAEHKLLFHIRELRGIQKSMQQLVL